MTLLEPFRARRTAKIDRWAELAELERIRWAWREACEGSGAGRVVDTASGPTTSTPKLTSVQLGPPTVFMVRLMPGQLAWDLRRVAHRLAPRLGGVALRVEPAGLGHARVEVLRSDPLLQPLPLDLAAPGLLIGRDEAGDDLRLADPAELPHVICQGQTRSGKSTWLYGLLAQLVRRADVLVAGVDPSGLLLRPFVGTRHGPWIVNSLADLGAIEALLLALVAGLDERLASMPSDRDVLPLGSDWPLVVAVFDEYPALLRAVDQADPKLGKRVRGLVARLLAESHKAGYRVVLAAQRAEASIVGAAERAQCGGRLSFRVDSIDSVRLLHPDGDELAAGHTSAPPGIALCSWPGRPLARLRGPLIGSYGDYTAAVAAACPPALREAS